MITGMIKCFYPNFIKTYQATITASSGTGVLNLIDGDRSTKWQSSAGGDSKTESILVTFSQAQSINRIVLINMNFKVFSIKYWDGAQFSSLEGVVSSDESVLGGIYGSSVYGVALAGSGAHSNNNTLNTRYYEFNDVTTSQIIIEVSHTIIANQPKFMHGLYIGVEIGTFISDLCSKPNSFKSEVRVRNSRLIKLSNGGAVVFDRSDKYSAEIRIKHLWDQSDLSLVDTLFDLSEFCIYPCGGSSIYSTRGWRLEDFYSVVLDSDQQGDFSIGRVANLGNDYQLNIFEQ
jgi:hypothetical protein